MPSNVATSLTLALAGNHIEQVVAIHRRSPLVSRHAVAKCAFLLGLEALVRDPDALTQHLLAQRRGSEANAEGDVASASERKQRG